MNKNKPETDFSRWEILKEGVGAFLRDLLIYTILICLAFAVFLACTSEKVLGGATTEFNEEKLNILAEEMIDSRRAYYSALKKVAQQKVDNGEECISDDCSVIIQNCNIELGIAPPPDPLDALAYAVAMHETHDCEDDTNFTRVNNCHGIRKWNGVALVPARYASKKESHADFKEIWGRMYDGRSTPTFADAERYSGKDNALAWYNNVNYFLKTL